MFKRIRIDIKVEDESNIDKTHALLMRLMEGFVPEVDFKALKRLDDEYFYLPVLSQEKIGDWN